MKEDNLPTLDLTEDLELCIVCAERYACGRMTYMPDIVQRVIRQLLPDLSAKTLKIMHNDLTAPGSDQEYFFGDPTVDKPGWIKLLAEIDKEINEREKSHVNKI